MRLITNVAQESGISKQGGPPSAALVHQTRYGFGDASEFLAMGSSYADDRGCGEWTGYGTKEGDGSTSGTVFFGWMLGAEYMYQLLVEWWNG